MPSIEYIITANHPILKYVTEIVYTSREASSRKSYLQSLGYEVTINKRNLVS